MPSLSAKSHRSLNTTTVAPRSALSVAPYSHGRCCYLPHEPSALRGKPMVGAAQFPATATPHLVLQGLSSACVCVTD